MNIVITACNGFIGRALTKRLPDHCRLVELCAHPFPLPYHPNLRSAKQPISELTRADAAKLFDGEKFALVHLAWHSPREKHYGVAAGQVQDTAHLLEVTKEYLTHFVSLGSSDEFGNREGKLTADAPFSGMLSPYGWSKRCAASLIANFTMGSDMNAFWLRPFTVYGEQHYGSMLLPYAVAQARARRDAYFSDGLQQRDFIHVDDVVEAIWQALKCDTKGFHALNLGWGEPVEVRKVILEIARRLDAESFFHLGLVKRRIDEPMIRYADTTAAHLLLDWRPRITLMEGLDRLVADEANDVLAAYAESRRAANAHHE
jgi:nucleoside-diphosphate-sugar epimerase